MFDNFTDSTRELIFKAQNIALINHNTQIEPVHILLGATNSGIEGVELYLNELKLNTNIFKKDLENIISDLAKTQNPQSNIFFSKDSLLLFEKAQEKAKSLKDKKIHILFINYPKNQKQI